MAAKSPLQEAVQDLLPEATLAAAIAALDYIEGDSSAVCLAGLASRSGVVIHCCAGLCRWTVRSIALFEFLIQPACRTPLINW